MSNSNDNKIIIIHYSGWPRNYYNHCYPLVSDVHALSLIYYILRKHKTRKVSN